MPDANDAVFLSNKDAVVGGEGDGRRRGEVGDDHFADEAGGQVGRSVSGSRERLSGDDEHIDDQHAAQQNPETSAKGIRAFHLNIQSDPLALLSVLFCRVNKSINQILKTLWEVLRISVVNFFCEPFVWVWWVIGAVEQRRVAQPSRAQL